MFETTNQMFMGVIQTYTNLDGREGLPFQHFQLLAECCNSREDRTVVRVKVVENVNF
jgi:hypothetical protein